MAMIALRKNGPAKPVESQCKKPRGWMGRYTLWSMSRRQSKVTDWGLTHVSIQPEFTVLDVGCGGGRTISKLAAIASRGKVYGIDYSEASVAASQKYNAREIEAGRVDVQQASVSQLPFAAATFDLVTAVETHFWWPNLPGDVREILRVLKPGGTLVLIAEIYKGASASMSRVCEKYAHLTGLKMLSPEEHRELLASAGFSNTAIDTIPKKGWITAAARK
jgi:SAM-dependent methyltransferase